MTGDQAPQGGPRGAGHDGNQTIIRCSRTSVQASKLKEIHPFS